jgi:hypothetical protein
MPFIGIVDPLYSNHHTCAHPVEHEAQERELRPPTGSGFRACKGIDRRPTEVENPPSARSGMASANFAL